MELKEIAQHFGIFFKEDFDYSQEENRVNKLKKEDLLDEYMILFKKYNQLKEDSNNVELIREELEEKKERFSILLHKYEHISAINIEYLKRYGEIKGLGVKK